MMFSYGLNNLAYLWIWEEWSKIFFIMISSQIFFHFAFMSRHIFPPCSKILLRASPIDSISPEDSFHFFSSVLCKVKVKVKVKSLSRVWLIATPWTVAHQAPPSMGFSRQEYWSGLPCKYLPIVWKVTEAQSHIPENPQAPLSLPSQETLVQETMKKLSYTKASLQSSLESMAFLF